MSDTPIPEALQAALQRFASEEVVPTDKLPEFMRGVREVWFYYPDRDDMPSAMTDQPYYQAGRALGMALKIFPRSSS